MTSNDKSNDGSAGTLPTPLSYDSPEQILEPATSELFLDLAPLNSIANGKSIRVPKNPHFTRKDVVQAFQTAFDLIGGVPRLALWANENESDFYKLYARLLPSQSSSALGESNILKIEMAIRPGALDE